MMNNKKSVSGMSFGTLLTIVVIIGILIILFILSGRASNEGVSLMTKIKEFIPFI